MMDILVFEHATANRGNLIPIRMGVPSPKAGYLHAIGTNHTADIVTLGANIESKEFCL